MQSQLVAENRRLRRRIADLEVRLVNAHTYSEQVDAIALQNEQLAATSRLAALVAHELNTPLQTVENYLFLADDMVSLAGVMPALRREVGRISDVVQRLLEFQPIESDTSAPLFLNRMVERVLLLTGSRLRRQRITVLSDLAPGLPPLLGRDGELTLVLLNLILRAAEAMPDGGVLRISTQGPVPGAGRRDDAITIEIIDSGHRSGEADSQSAPFYSTEAAGPELRLEICRRLIANHGGTLMLWEELGGGHRVAVILPLRAGPTP